MAWSDDEGVRDLLARARVGYLGLADGAEPYVVPLNYVWQNGCVYFHGAAHGRKATLMAAPSRATFVVAEENGTITHPVPAKTDTVYDSVMLFGEVAAVGDAEERHTAMQALLDKYVPGYYGTPLPRGHVEAYRSSAGSTTRVFRLAPDRMTAKRNVDAQDALFYPGRTQLADVRRQAADRRAAEGAVAGSESGQPSGTVSEAWVFPDLAGECVVLRALCPGDAAALTAAGHNPEIWRYTSAHPLGLDAMRVWVVAALTQRATGGQWPYAVHDRALGRLVGSTRYLFLNPSARTLEIGWTWYDPAVWRTRVNTECKYLLLRHAFETLGCNRVQFKADVRNDRSNRAIQRIGAVREGRLRRDNTLPDGHVRDAYVYSIIREEWPRVKTRLKGWLV
jgi:nitroimidazol reductase NimA-like FMN-containing flavoprotein (pyridoxamine 5'-phosphate oxidase superfamily)/RimJ/RimL family protein N-acetyltransferase